MFLRNDSGRELFIPTIGGVGAHFGIGQTKEVADSFRFDRVVDTEINKGTLTVTGYNVDPSSVVTHDELAISAGTAGAHALQIQEQRHSTTSTTFVTAASLIIDYNRLNLISVELLWSQVAVPVTSADVRLYNVTDASTIVTSTGISTPGIKTLAVSSFPTGKKLTALQHRAIGGGQSRIEGGTLFMG